jgi:hypothetical protein
LTKKCGWAKIPLVTLTSKVGLAELRRVKVWKFKKIKIFRAEAKPWIFLTLCFCEVFFQAHL